MENLPSRFNFEEFFFRFRYPLLILLLGLILVCFGAFYFKSGLISGGTKVEVLNVTTQDLTQKEMAVEISGQVQKPGVYKLPNGSRIEDLLIVAGGFSVDADGLWVDKYLNRAAKLTDGQKIYVPAVGEQSGSTSAKNSGADQTVSTNFGDQGSGLVNVNTASAKELDSLPGIGPVYAQNIIEHRPYSTTEELVSKEAIKQSLYDKIKDKITIY
jgi:competence protein ComEA